MEERVPAMDVHESRSALEQQSLNQGKLDQFSLTAHPKILPHDFLEHKLAESQQVTQSRRKRADVVRFVNVCFRGIPSSLTRNKAIVEPPRLDNYSVTSIAQSGKPRYWRLCLSSIDPICQVSCPEEGEFVLSVKQREYSGALNKPPRLKSSPSALLLENNDSGYDDDYELFSQLRPSSLTNQTKPSSSSSASITNDNAKNRVVLVTLKETRTGEIHPIFNHALLVLHPVSTDSEQSTDVELSSPSSPSSWNVQRVLLCYLPPSVVAPSPREEEEEEEEEEESVMNVVPKAAITSSAPTNENEYSQMWSMSCALAEEKEEENERRKLKRELIDDQRQQRKEKEKDEAKEREPADPSQPPKRKKPRIPG